MFSKYQDKKSLRSLQKNPNWKLLKFSDVLRDETKNAKKIKKEEYLAQGSYPIIDQGKDYIAGFTNDGDGIYDKSPLIIFGDHTRILKYIDFPIFIGADGVKLLKNVFSEEEVLTKYIYYYLRTVNIPDTGYNRHFKFLKEVVIPIPSINLQKRIVSVLDKAQELIDKRKAQIEALDQLTQSVFLEMFGDPWINPKKWRVKKIKEVIKNKPINGFFAKNEQYSDKGNAKIIWISDFINKRSANIHGLKKVVATEEDIKKYQVKYGDILFCRSSLNVDGIGKAAYVPEFPKDENIIFECHIIKITLSDEVLPEFFQVLSETKFFRNQIIKHSKTSTMTTISQSGIMECSIIVPPVQIQNQFLQILKKIEYEKQKLQNSLSLLNDNFNSLMQRAFKGELFND